MWGLMFYKRSSLVFSLLISPCCLVQADSVQALSLPVVLNYKAAGVQIYQGSDNLDLYALYNKPAMLDGDTFDGKKMTFKDIIGGVPSEIEDLKKFLENASDYQKAGAIMPKGYVFYGPPGTGKTLLARALAGEVDAAFFATSGSGLSTEKYVGDGVRKVKDIFANARYAVKYQGYKQAIIFVDELDSIGRRSSGEDSAAQDRNNTINEFLVQMDGFSQNDNIIVVGATNRLELLDDALKRSGRFEMHIEINLPDVKKREALLKHYTSSQFNRKLDADVDLNFFAQQTNNFNCADIALFVNRAAIYVARQKKTVINKEAMLAALKQMDKK